MNRLLKYLPTLIFLMFGIVLVGYATPWLSDWAQKHRTGGYADIVKPLNQPYINYNSEIPNNRVAPGHLFFVRYAFARDMNCEIQATAYLLNRKSKVLYSFNATTTTWMMPGAYDFNEAYILPKSVPYGDYQFERKTISTCAGVQYYTLSYSIPISVVPPEMVK